VIGLASHNTAKEEARVPVDTVIALGSLSSALLPRASTEKAIKVSQHGEIPRFAAAT